MKFKKFLPDSCLTKDPVLKKLVMVGFLLLVGQVLAIILSFSRLPSSLPLFYSRPWGSAQLAKKTTFWLLPLLSTLVFIFNLVLAHFLFNLEKILSTTLIVGVIVFNFLIFLTELKIIFLFY